VAAPVIAVDAAKGTILQQHLPHVILSPT
jgi:hypothetical protein